MTGMTSLEFRAEFFDGFSHVQSNNSVGNFASAQFGQAISSRSPRIGQLALKFFF